MIEDLTACFARLVDPQVRSSTGARHEISSVRLGRLLSVRLGLPQVGGLRRRPVLAHRAVCARVCDKPAFVVGSGDISRVVPRTRLHAR